VKELLRISSFGAFWAWQIFIKLSRFARDLFIIQVDRLWEFNARWRHQLRFANYSSKRRIGAKPNRPKVFLWRKNDVALDFFENFTERNMPVKDA